MAVKYNDLDKVFGLKVTELLHTGTREALPRDCSACSRPNLLLSLQTGYCVSHDPIDIHTYTVIRGCVASKNTRFSLALMSSSIGFFFPEQSQLCWPLFVVQHPSSTQTYPWTSALRCQRQFFANRQSLQSPPYQMPTYRSWQRMVQAEGAREHFTAPLCSHLADQRGLMGLFACSLILEDPAEKQKRRALMQEPLAMLFAASLGSGSAKISESSLDLPGQLILKRLR